MAHLYADHGAAVFALATRCCGLSRAADVTQDTFLRLWQRPERFDPGRGSMRTYLLTVAHGIAVDLVRSDTARRAREERSQRLTVHDGVDDRSLQDGRSQDIRELLHALPSIERDSIVAAYYGSRTYREAAAALGIPEGTLKSRIRSGLRRLRTLMDVAGAD